jgi:hypothetical protein
MRAISLVIDVAALRTRRTLGCSQNPAAAFAATIGTMIGSNVDHIDGISTTVKEIAPSTTPLAGVAGRSQDGNPTEGESSHSGKSLPARLLGVIASMGQLLAQLAAPCEFANGCLALTDFADPG